MFAPKIKSEPVKPFPAVTVCNINPFRTEALKDLPEFQALVNFIVEEKFHAHI